MAILRDVLDVLCCLAAAFTLRMFVVEFVKVKGRSMLSTLRNGEVMLVSRLAYRLGKPRRFDVVICHYPGRYMDKRKWFRQCFVKRVIALPGETIAMEEGVVLINGVAMEEAFLDENHNRRKRDMAPRTLGPDEYFVMGDNRDSSNDSRSIGPIRRKEIIGRARVVLWPVRGWRRIR
ncbi:MAG: signal peptidase I [Clostridia bacterium]|nr:signal peptidase I [Clostridia bacterium]